jgi:FkbM family methyltransferase
MRDASNADALPFGDGVVINTVVRGLTMRFAAYNRAMSLCARMNYEPENLDFIDAMTPAAVFYDLGACEGRFSLYAALRGHRVYAFEPEAMNFAALLDNRTLNGPTAVDNLHPLQLGVGATNGEAMLKVGQPWAGGHHKVVETGSARADLDFQFVSRQEIRTVSLDSHIAETGAPAPQYLKVDIDGSELPFLDGAKRTLADPGLLGILFELCRTDASYAQIVAFLTAQGFAVAGEYEVEPRLFNVHFVRAAA